MCSKVGMDRMHSVGNAPYTLMIHQTRSYIFKHSSVMWRYSYLRAVESGAILQLSVWRPCKEWDVNVLHDTSQWTVAIWEPYVTQHHWICSDERGRTDHTDGKVIRTVWLIVEWLIGVVISDKFKCASFNNPPFECNKEDTKIKKTINKLKNL